MLAFLSGLMSLIGFVESLSVAKSLAAKKREKVDPNQELIGLGAANLVSSLIVTESPPTMTCCWFVLMKTYILPIPASLNNSSDSFHPTKK